MSNLPRPTANTVDRITVREPVLESNEFEGQLLQIHPVELSGGLIPIGKNDFIIGRDATCNLTIAEESVSRKHAQIELTDGLYQIKDLGSTNGTWVNCKSVQSTELDGGDRIRIGSRIFKFIATDEVEAQYHEAVYSMMTKDSLTGIWNKRFFHDMFSRELKRRQRSKQPLSLLMIDADNFKSTNDKYGHLAGDEVLTEMTRRIQLCIREEDIFARYGGEEFALALYDADKSGAMEVAERCREIVETTPIQTMAGPVNCSISIGVAVVSEANPFSTMNEILKLADVNLYRAKTAGRNQVCCEL